MVPCGGSTKKNAEGLDRADRRGRKSREGTGVGIHPFIEANDGRQVPLGDHRRHGRPEVEQSRGNREKAGWLKSTANASSRGHCSAAL